MISKFDNTTHLAFSDETKYNEGKFRGLGLITLRQRDYDVCLTRLNEVLTSSGIKDFKWRNLGSARERLAAKKLIDLSIQFVIQGIIRIDVLSWDIGCSRHKIRGRDDIANLERMYYHVYRWVLGNRWPKGSKWALYPDEHSAINWGTIHKYLGLKGSKTERNLDFTSEPDFWRLIKSFQVVSLDQVNSEKEAFVQLADFYVGMCVYSRGSFDQYKKWSFERNSQRLLFDPVHLDSVRLSNIDQERCEVLNYFKNCCDKHQLGVSLDSSKGLKTHDPKRAVNSWWYMARHQDDKAPIKSWAVN